MYWLYNAAIMGKQREACTREYGKDQDGQLGKSCFIAFLTSCVNKALLRPHLPF